MMIIGETKRKKSPSLPGRGRSLSSFCEQIRLSNSVYLLAELTSGIMDSGNRLPVLARKGGESSKEKMENDGLWSE